MTYFNWYPDIKRHIVIFWYLTLWICWCAGLLSVMDLVEVNPVLGANPEAVEATASLAVDVIASSLGQTREGAHASIDEIPSVKEDTEKLRIWEQNAKLWTVSHHPSAFRSFRYKTAQTESYICWSYELFVPTSLLFSVMFKPWKWSWFKKKQTNKKKLLHIVTGLPLF